jgi:hypothetical protein
MWETDLRSIALAAGSLWKVDGPIGHHLTHIYLRPSVIPRSIHPEDGYRKV